MSCTASYLISFSISDAGESQLMRRSSRKATSNHVENRFSSSASSASSRLSLFSWGSNSARRSTRNRMPFGKNRKALQQTGARRHEGPAQPDLGLALLGCALRRLVLRSHRLDLLGVGCELLAHQQPAVAPLLGRGLGIPAGHALGAAPAFHLADLRIDDGFQFGERAAQHPRRQRLLMPAQRRLSRRQARARAWTRRCRRRAARAQQRELRPSLPTSIRWLRASSRSASRWRVRWVRIAASAPSGSRALSAANTARCSDRLCSNRPGACSCCSRASLTILRRSPITCASQRLLASVMIASWIVKLAA